jgi:peroxiredoxin
VASRVGIALPALKLRATDGSDVDLSVVQGRVVVFCYPYTGRANHANPEGWDHIPGAHGSTPQALAFSKRYAEFAILHVKIFGLSFLSPEWQKDFLNTNGLPFSLLSDEHRRFSDALELDTFQAGDVDYITRRSFIANDGVITHDIYPVISPEHNAAEILELLRR